MDGAKEEGAAGVLETSAREEGDRPSGSQGAGGRVR